MWSSSLLCHLTCQWEEPSLGFVKGWTLLLPATSPVLWTTPQTKSTMCEQITQGGIAAGAGGPVVNGCGGEVSGRR